MEINYTIRDQVYDILKQNIVSGEYHIGEQLKENEIAQKLRVSRSPVREAFRQLASDGLITNVANKGVYVKEVDIKSVDDILDVRIMFEQKGIYNLNNLDKSSVQRLKDIRKNMISAFESGDFDAYSRADFELHSEIISFCDNNTITQFSEKIYSVIQMLRNIALKNVDRMKSSYKEHLKIIDLLMAGEYEQAWNADKEHLIYTGNEIKNFLYSRGSKIPEKVGIFGGCFDPVHVGHLSLINAVRAQIDLQKVIILPSYQPIHKPDITASYENRIEMCKLAFDDDARLEVNDAERRLSTGKYFCDFLRCFNTSLNDIYLIMGPDAYLSLSYWKGNEYIIKNTTLCTFLPENDTELLNCSEYFRNIGGRTVFIEYEPIDISSSLIRADIESARDMLPSGVYDYILRNKLYT